MRLMKAKAIRFPPEYKTQLFMQWYNLGKPNVNVFIRQVDECEVTGTKWIHEDFVEMAKTLDDQVIRTMNEKLVQEKVAMLSRHARVGEEMQNLALEYLRTKDLDSSASAIRLWMEGTKLERDSRGIPEMIKKMMSLSDDDLLKEISNMVTNSPLKLDYPDEDVLDVK
jgi:hypothetical protein